MESIKELNIDARYLGNSKISKEITYFQNLLKEIRKKTIPNLNTDYFNTLITELNDFKGSEKGFKKLLRKNKNLIFRNLEKEHKITPRNYHRNRWMGIGMLIYGIPIGIVLSTTLGNFAFIGIGIPFGLSIGIAIGTNKDKKAKDEGRQLDIETS